MKKSILNLGAQELTKNEQKSINGGKRAPRPFNCNLGDLCPIDPNSPSKERYECCPQGHCASTGYCIEL